MKEIRVATSSVRPAVHEKSTLARLASIWGVKSGSDRILKTHPSKDWEIHTSQSKSLGG